MNEGTPFINTGTIVGIVSGLITAVVLIATGFVFLLALGLALNGFMGQQRAVDAAFVSYLVLAVITGFLSLMLCCGLGYTLTLKRGWHWAGSSILSIVVGCLVGGGLHFVSMLIATIVASSLRTGPK